MACSSLGRVLAALLLCSAPLEAQRNPSDGTVQGHVVDYTTDRPVVSATVQILDADGKVRAQTVTDESGAFLLSRLDPGPFRLRIRSLGYEETVTPRWWVETGETLTVRIRVDPEALLLAPLEIVARSRSASPVLSGFFRRLEQGIMGTFITREDIEARAAMRVTDLLAEVPGVRLQGVASGTGDPRRDQTVTFGRTVGTGFAGGCPVQIYVDGLLATRGPAPVSVDELASPGLLEGIEIYQGLSTVPAEFMSPEARCGVVALWTRRGG